MNTSMTPSSGQIATELSPWLSGLLQWAGGTRAVSPRRIGELRCIVVVSVAILLAACGDTASDRPPVDLHTGGATTVFDRTSRAFTLPASGLTDLQLDRHADGDAAFEAQFVTPPADINPGLGPTFNNNSCNSCHVRNGRGGPNISAGSLRSQLLIRVSLPAGSGRSAQPGGPVPVPGFGAQLQDHATFGVEPEAFTSLHWQQTTGAYADGQTFTLRKPIVDVELPSGDTLGPNVLTSLRAPPPVFGLGLLEAIPEQTILERADPDDADDDGISGRPNYVWSIADEASTLGRFGHKANQPDLLQQSASAYHDDMGVTNPLIPAPNGAAEIDQTTLDAAVFYARTLGVPARRRVDKPMVRRGEKLFGRIGCADCHVPTVQTGPSPIAALADQTIHPYTDMLIHDMGQGLADGRPDFDASGREWRTAPLWGIGLTKTVLSGAGYLHDGRARTLAEAILWHGGEARAARERFRSQLTSTQRRSLIAFLRSL